MPQLPTVHIVEAGLVRRMLAITRVSLPGEHLVSTLLGHAREFDEEFREDMMVVNSLAIRPAQLPIPSRLCMLPLGSGDHGTSS